MWRNVHHVNCLPFYGVTTVNDGAPRTCLVSPWMVNGNLSVYLAHNSDVSRLPLVSAADSEMNIADWVLSGFGYCKRSGISAHDATHNCSRRSQECEFHHTAAPLVFIAHNVTQLNIFVTRSGRACLADFGLATAQGSQVNMATTSYGVAGTPGYMAPELMEAGENPALLPQLDRRRSDMFAFGCIIYEVRVPPSNQVDH